MPESNYPRKNRPGVGILLWLACAAVAFAQGPVPDEFRYQGRLEKDGFPVTATLPMTFRLFDAASGGSELFTTGSLQIVVSQGVFGADLTIPESVRNPFACAVRVASPMSPTT